MTSQEKEDVSKSGKISEREGGGDESQSRHSLERDILLDDRRSSGSNLSVTASSSNVPSSGPVSSSGLDNFANYVNIDYFLRNREETSSRNDSDDNDTQFSRSVCSEDEDGKSVESRDAIIAKGLSSTSGILPLHHRHQPTYDDVFHDPDLYGKFKTVSFKSCTLLLNDKFFATKKGMIVHSSD